VLSFRDILASKGNARLVLISAYDAISARLVDAARADVILVGDSLGVTALGYASIMPVTLDVMVHHVAAVARVAQRSLVIADMPFGSYGVSINDTLNHAVRLIKEGGAGGVKMAGGSNLAEEVQRLTAIGVPVMGHIGLLSHNTWLEQSEQPTGGDLLSRQQLLDDAAALTEAGCFALIVKGVVPSVTRAICAAVAIPVISIGSGPADGLGANIADVLGLGFGPKSWYSVRQWEGGREMAHRLHDFVTAVQTGQVLPPAAPETE